MTLTAPPQPPHESDPITREEAEALVDAILKEARQRTRRRRQRNAALAVIGTLVAVVVLTAFDRAAHSQSASPAVTTRLLVGDAASSQIAFITGPRASSCWGGGCGQGPPLEALGGKLYVVNADGS